MDMMFWMELAVVIIAIFIGAKWGGAGLGAAGGIGLGVLVFGFGMQPVRLPSACCSSSQPSLPAPRFCRAPAAWISW